MEMFAIILSFPSALVATLVYSYILKLIVKRWPLISKSVLLISTPIVILVIFEILGAITIGVVNLREFIGPSYYKIHIILFFISVPALAGVLSCQNIYKIISKPLVTAVVCGLFCMSIVLFHYSVSETLYEFGGRKGPYSDEPHYLDDMF